MYSCFVFKTFCSFRALVTAGNVLVFQHMSCASTLKFLPETQLTDSISIPRPSVLSERNEEGVSHAAAAPSLAPSRKSISTFRDRVHFMLRSLTAICSPVYSRERGSMAIPCNSEKKPYELTKAPWIEKHDYVRVEWLHVLPTPRGISERDLCSDCCCCWCFYLE